MTSFSVVRVLLAVLLIQSDTRLLFVDAGTSGKGKGSKSTKGVRCSLAYSGQYQAGNEYQVDPHELSAMDTHCGSDSDEDGSSVPGGQAPVASAVTPAPVVAPSVAPTAKPIVQPTTPSPTSNPTEKPAPEPTNRPTAVPTFVPTAKPTEILSAATPVPSDVPSDSPSKNPTDWPSLGPSEVPTLSPTKYSGCPGYSIAERRSAMREVVNGVSGAALLNDETSPQALAFNWLVDDDGLRLCPEDANVAQRYALAVFYFSLAGDEWYTCTRDESTPCEGQRFLSDMHECLWGGLGCGSGRRLESINLDANNMVGTIPDEIKVFEKLVEFDVDRNGLTGPIPTYFGQLTALTYLDMDNNTLSGAIPEELYDLTSLMSLDLDSNRLSGTISTKLGQLINLFIVQYDLNLLTGAIPSEAGLLVNLGYFTATGNSFSSPVPVELCGVPSEALVVNCDLCVIDFCCTECTNPATTRK